MGTMHDLGHDLPYLHALLTTMQVGMMHRGVWRQLLQPNPLSVLSFQFLQQSGNSSPFPPGHHAP